MAYNGFFPIGYNPYLPQTQTAQNAPQGQIQTNGLISVRNRNEAQNYPVAPGNSVTFKDETAPFVYVKTMGFSQLDRPSFEVFRLIKEDVETEPQTETVDYVKREELKPILDRLEAIEKKRTELFADD